MSVLNNNIIIYDRRILSTAWFVGNSSWLDIELWLPQNPYLAEFAAVLCLLHTALHCSPKILRPQVLQRGSAESQTCQSFQRMVFLSTSVGLACNRKFQAAESLRALARASYEKSRASRPLTGVTGSPKSSPSRPLTNVAGSPKSSRVMAPRKRSKDTSGIGVSPHTHQARPTAKRQTVGASGRKLCFPVQDESMKK